MGPVNPTDSLQLQRIATVAAGMLAGTTDLLDGCRTIAHLRSDLPEPARSDPDLLPFLAVESELEDVPMASAQHLWDADAFQQKQQEKEDYLRSVKGQLVSACNAVVSRWLRRPTEEPLIEEGE